MQLSKQTHHAIRILVRCARAGTKRLRAADIARAERITEYNVAKIVPILVRAGFVETVRGRAGGIVLARPAGEIRIGDVVRVTEGAKMKSARKGGTPRSAPKRAGKPIAQVIGDALEAFVSVLDLHTISDLAGAKRGQEDVIGTAAKEPARPKARSRATAA